MTTLLGPTGQPISSATMIGDERTQQMRRALEHYEGNPQPPLRMQNGIDDNLIISLARLVVDKGVAFLVGQAVEPQVSDAPTDAPQDWLDACWRANKRPLTLTKWATNGAIFGHAFIRLLDRQPFPRLVVLDPRTVDVVTDPDDVDTVRSYTITPPPHIEDPDDDGDGDLVRRRTLIVDETAGYRPDGEPEQWTIHDQRYSGGAWVTELSTPWPHPFSPIVHCQNLPKANDFWGESDIPEDVLKILDGINGVASRMNKIIRMHAHPKVYTVGMGTRNLDLSIDSVISLPSEKADMRALEMQSDLTASLNFLNKLLNLLSMLVRIPLVALGEPDNLGAISGVALEIRYQPLVEKTTLKRESYGDALTELDRRLLAMAPLGFGDQILTTQHWREMLPGDPLQERQVAVIDAELGIVSKETLSDKFGFDWTEEQKRIADEQTKERAANVAAGLNPDGSVPAPAPIAPQKPDQAKTARST